MVTITLAHTVQSWFTSCMATTETTKPRKRETITQKAERMVAEGRYEEIRVGAQGAFWVGTCRGDHGRYAVFAIAQWFMDAHGMAGGRVGCNCRYGNSARLCSHALGAEQLRKQEEG